MQSTLFNQTSTLVFRPNQTGIVECMAINSVGVGQAKANLVVNDLDDDLIVWSNNTLPISYGDDVSVWCGASAHKYETELNWYKDNELVQSGNGKSNAHHIRNTHSTSIPYFPDFSISQVLK